MRAVTHSRYILALTDNAVSDEVRSAYRADMREEEKGAQLLGTILSAAVKAVLDRRLAVEAAQKMVQEEFSAWGLEDILGSYSKYEKLTQAFLEEPFSDSKRVQRCKRLTDAVQDADRAVKDGVYLGVVGGLSSVWMVLRDLEYVKEVTDYAVGADNMAYEVEIFRNLTDIVLAERTVEERKKDTAGAEATGKS